MQFGAGIIFHLIFSTHKQAKNKPRNCLCHAQMTRKCRLNVRDPSSLFIKNYIAVPISLALLL